MSENNSWDDISDAFWLMRYSRFALSLVIVLIVGFLALIDRFGFWLAFLMAIVAPSVLIGIGAFLFDLLLRHGDRVRNKARQKPGDSAMELLRYRVGASGYSVVIEGVKDANVVALAIPDVIEGVDVTEIAANAFAACPRLTEVRAPRGLERVGERAFANCQLLREVKLSKRTVAIGSEAFACCRSLRTIKLPKLLQTIGARAFQGCTGLESVEIPFGVREIASDAFPPSVTLKVYRGSEAERWAQRLGRNVHLILCAEE
ncbi:MAG: leucine-rich repeat domain-containing protein [Thermoguttaceae bacterium]|nr:leucine-rich repeat domain-containing protein [Thermoguttaceae bacterium]